ncbi:MAG: PQQ-like beta-propeller repeat protein [Anaerolineae bacterium]|jgi:outer membrane protein assembly factor BamB|nr:PQQ-like beta-propeller repeat protein [Anaerolineae bacterium]
MTRFVPSRRLSLLAALLILVLVTTGCVGSRLGVSWASVSLVGENQNILLAFNNFIVQIDPRDGSAVQLRDENGNIRVVPETGEPRAWNYQETSAGAQHFYTAPLQLNEGKLLFADYARKLVEVDLVAARVDNPAGIPIPDHVVADPIVDDQHLYLAYLNKDVQARDIDDPSVVIWTFETENGVWSEPLLHEGVLYFGAMDHYLYAVEAATGQLRWKVDLQGAVAATPALYEGNLYIGSFARKLFIVSLEGEIVSERAVDDWVWGAPVALDGVVYAADMGGNVYALSTDDLSEVWRVRAANGGIRPSPLVTEQHVIIGARSGEVVWLERASGVIALEGARQLGAEILSDLMLVESNEARPLAEPLVIVSTVANDNLLVAFSATQGVRQWVYKR